MDEALEAAQKAAKNAKRAMVLTVGAVMVAVLVMVIDQSIKRAVLDQAARAHKLLFEAQALAEGVRDGAKAAGENRSGPGADERAGDDVVRDAPAGKVLGETSAPAKPAPARRPARAPRGPRGDD